MLISGVGCAVTREDSAYVSKLPDHTSIFTAELMAVATVSDQLFNSSDLNSVKYSDSRNTLENIKKFNSFISQFKKVLEWLFWICYRRKSFHFCWCPLLVGIHGNEVAERETKIAAQSAYITFDIVLPLILEDQLNHTF